MSDLTDRELAIRWWNRKSKEDKLDLIDKVGLKLRTNEALTLLGIEHIWRSQQKLN